MWSAERVDGAAASGSTVVAVASVPSVAHASSTNEVKHLADRLNAAQIKLKRLKRLEAALVDFFMEVMDRTTPGSSATATTNRDVTKSQFGSSEQVDSVYARQKRKEQFLRRADGDPIALLNALRTHLRLQFTAQSEHQQHMSSTLSSVTAHSGSQEKDAKQALQHLEAANDALRVHVDTLVQQVSHSESDRQRLDRHYKSYLERMSSELHRLRVQDESSSQRIQQQQLQIESLQQTSDALAKEKKKLTDELYSATTGGGGGGARGASFRSDCLGSSTSNMLGSTPAETQTLRRALRDYEGKISKLEAAADEWRLEVQRLQQQLVNVRHTTQAQAVAKLEKDLKTTTTLADELKQRLSVRDAELLRTKAALKATNARIPPMKDEYNKLFAALQKIKSTTSTSSLSPSKLTRIASESKLTDRSLQATASTPSLLTASGTANTTHISSCNNPTASATSTAVSARGGASSAHTVMRTPANEHPYLIEHYKSRMEHLEREIDGLKVQIRKMIASEYRHKQKNREFQIERSQLVETCNRLRLELDESLVASTKARANAHKQQLLATNNSRPSSNERLGSAMRVDAPSLLDSERRACSTGGAALNEVKKLRERNLFLEDRFRSIIESANAHSGGKIAPSSCKSGASAVATRPASAGSHLQSTKRATLVDGFDDVDSGDDDSGDDDESILDNPATRGGDAAAAASIASLPPRGPSNAFATQASAPATAHVSTAFDTPNSDRSSNDTTIKTPSGSLDTRALQALQQVKTKTRVRPQSASQQVYTCARR